MISLYLINFSDLFESLATISLIISHNTYWPRHGQIDHRGTGSPTKFETLSNFFLATR